MTLGGCSRNKICSDVRVWMFSFFYPAQRMRPNLSELNCSPEAADQTKSLVLLLVCVAYFPKRRPTHACPGEQPTTWAMLNCYVAVSMDSLCCTGVCSNQVEPQRKCIVQAQSPRRRVPPCLRGGQTATRPTRTTACENPWTWTLQPASEFYRRVVDEWETIDTIDESPASASSRSGRKGTPWPAPASRRSEHARTCILRACASLQTPLLPSAPTTNNEACEMRVF